MKTQVFSLTIFISLLMIINSHNLQNQKQNHKENGTEYKTYLVKTKLTKEELESLLKEEETHLVNLRKQKGNHTSGNKSTTVEKVEHSGNLTDYEFEKKIENQIRDDALHPVHEFRLEKNEVQTLVTKSDARFMNFLYEKRFGKFYGYLTLILFIFVLCYYNNIIFNQKKCINKKDYINSYYNDKEKEYMLVKNN